MLQLDQVLLSVYPYVSKSPLKKGAGTILLAVHSLHVGIEKDVDEPEQGQVLILSQTKVVMVGHQAVHNDTDAVWMTVALDQMETILVIARIEEEQTLPCAPV